MGRPVAMTLMGLMTLLTGLVMSYNIPDYNLQPPFGEIIPPSDSATPQQTPIVHSSLPAVDIKNINENSSPKFGSIRLPLRDAVESIPLHHSLSIQSKNSPAIRNDVNEFIVTSERLYVRSGSRDAVERRPPPSLGPNIPDHKIIFLEQRAAPLTTRRYNNNSTKIICHINSTGLHRTEPLTFLPHSIPRRMCTHIIYNGATTIDPAKSIIKSKNPEYDEIKGGFKALIGLKKKDPSIRILLTIEVDKKYTQCCEQLSQSILKLVDKYEFDGVEIDWKNNDKKDLITLLRLLHNPMRSNSLITAVTQRPSDAASPQILPLVDLLILRSWSSLDSKSVTKSHQPTTMKLVRALIDKWTSSDINEQFRSKIILSVPLFGYSFTMKYENGIGGNAAAVGPGISGAYTKSRGFLAYHEVCDVVQQDNSWSAGRDEDGAYIKRGDQWIGYSDPISMKIFAAYIKTVGLGGVSLFSLDLDDFLGLCGDAWPILNTAFNDLNTYYAHDNNLIGKCQQKYDLYPDNNNCAGYFICDDGQLYRGYCGKGRFFDKTKNKCVKASPDICKLSNMNDKYQNDRKKIIRDDNDDKKKIICYITSWALYRKDDGKFVPENLDRNLCTHIVYAFAGLNPDHLTIQEFDPWADIDNKLYERTTSVGTKKVLLALGGWTDSTNDKYSRLVNNPISRKKFISSAIDFLLKYNFDGISIEWNYPKCWQSDCTQGPDTDRPNFTKLIQELRHAFDDHEESRGLMLAVSVSGYKEIIDRAYDIDKISDAVDFISVMTFDYSGSWESKTGHLSPLYAMPDDKNPYYNVNWTMNYLSSLGGKKSKLLVGVPFYGQSYRLAHSSSYEIGDGATGPGTPGEFTRQPGMLAYYEICDRIKRQSWKVGKGPSAHGNNQFVSHEDARSAGEKAKWVADNGYGGVTAWTVDLDDFSNRCCREAFPLLRSLNRGLGRLTERPPSVDNCTSPMKPVTPEPPIMTEHSDANDGGARPTRPMTSSTTMKSTTWPTWTDRPSTTTTQKSTTNWPTWTWAPSTTAPTTTTPRRPPTQVTTTTRRPSTPPARVCANGEYKPDPVDCGNYYRCVQGELKREYCAPGLHWDNSRRICDWPSAAKCQQTPSPLATTKKPSTTTAKPIVIKPVNGMTQDCEHGQYYAYPESCTQFLICVNDNLVLQQCGPGLNWNDEKKMCDWASQNPCMKSNKNLALMMKDVEENKGNDECVSGSFTAVKGDCGSYQSCLWGKPEINHCPSGLHFNRQTSACDWPDRAKCESYSGTTKRPPVNNQGHKTERPMIQPTTSPSPKPTVPSAEIDQIAVSPLSGYFKVVCYFTNWAWYRRGSGKYLPQHIDHTLCTHIIYGFAVLDYSELTIKAHDSWADYDNHFYERVVAYKQRGLKVLLALGGWNDSAGDKYSRLVNSPSARRKFVDHVIKFIEKYNFDGLDLDWEYPVCWQVDCRKGPSSDKAGFTALIKELSDKFKVRNLLLSAAVSPSKTVIDQAYDVPALSKYLDWISVMTYDYFGQWDKKTGHVAPLYHHPEVEPSYFNGNFTMNYWIEKGASARKLIMGIPLYGQSFTINDPKGSRGHGLNAPGSAGLAGEFTQAAGFLAYYEICDRINNHGWKVVQDEWRLMGPYAYKGNQWVSFDDPDMVRQKAQFIRDNGLGGGMVWALDLDDFRGKCGQGRHPLMHTLQQVLAGPPNRHDHPPTVIVQPPPKTTEVDQEEANQVSSTLNIHNQNNRNGNKEQFKVVCYFTNWAWYRQEGGKFLPENIDSDLCTHIIYGFAVLDSSTLTIKPHDSWADIDNKFYERVVAYKAKGIKVSIAIGGWNDSEGNKYSRLVNSASARMKFISHVMDFIEKYEFDGLDLDWEYPVCWQVDCNKGPASDKDSFTALVKELSVKFKPKGLLLSSAVSPSKRVIDAGYDVPVIAQHLDWIAIMAYDYHGHFDKKTGHVAPLYVREDDWEPTFNANFTVNYWIEKGAPTNKLVMGMPLYGQSFSLAERNANGLNSATYGGGEAGDATRARGFLSYYEICERVLKRDWTVVQDPKRRIGPYAYKGDQWVSFDDVEQIKLKSEFVKNHNLAGAMVWALDLDDFENRCGCEASPLLRTINRVLRNYPDGPSCSLSDHAVVENVDNIKPVTTARPSKPTTTTEAPDSVEIESGSPPPAMIPIGECTEGEQYRPHKDDCSKYLICNFGQLSVLSCPDGLYWNKRHCDWPENTKCKNSNNKYNEHY